MAEDPDRPDAPGIAARWQHPVWVAVGVLVAYYAFPVGWDGPTGVLVASLLLTVAGLSVIGWAMVLELRRVRAGATVRTGGVLAMMVVLLIATFALAFYLLELLMPRQFEGLETRTDALYFTLSTMATVGFGDVHAAGQLARALVCALIVFSVVVVTSLLRAAAAALNK